VFIPEPTKNNQPIDTSNPTERPTQLGFSFTNTKNQRHIIYEAVTSIIGNARSAPASLVPIGISVPGTTRTIPVPTPSKPDNKQALNPINRTKTSHRSVNRQFKQSKIEKIGPGY
jgi:hypothetical protein